MSHPIPRFTNVTLQPIPDLPPRYQDAEEAIHARRLDPRPEQLDKHIGWFPGASQKEYKKGSGRQQKRKSQD